MLTSTTQLCESYFANAASNLTGFALFYAISKCVEEKDNIGMGRGGGKGIDEFLTGVANEYFADASQILIIYDESWEISEMIAKLGEESRKSFITYFLPLDRELGKNIKSKPADHFTHKILPKATALIVFIKDEAAFENVLESTSFYPWWTARARIVVLVQEKSRDPGKGILELMEKQKIFNGVVVTEVDIRSDKSGGANITVAGFNSTAENNELIPSVALQIAALDPYPLPGQPKQFYVARWARSEYVMLQRPLFLSTIDNMRAHKLRACVFDFPPLVIRTEVTPGNYTYSGLEVLIFQELSKIMNFTYEFYEPLAEERWGIDLGNGTWNGLLGETQREADIGFASVFLVDNREKVVDVTTPYDQDKGCFAVPRPEALQHWLGLILPFSWKAWACILAMAFVAGPTFSLITRPLSHDQSFSVGKGIFYALGSMVATQKPPKAKSSALRSFIVSWLLFCWLACILYRVALIVSLTVGPSSFRIDTIRQLIRAGLEWGGFNETAQTFTSLNSTDDQVMLERFEPVTNITAALDRVAVDGDFAVLDSGKYLRYAANSRYYDGYSSSIYVAKECPLIYNVGFIMPIGSPFLDRFNQVIRRMQNSGLIEKWLSNIIFEAALKAPNKNRKRKYKGLSIDNLKLCLIIVFGGYFSAFIMLCAETCLKAYRDNKDKIVMLTIRKESHVSMSPSVVITDTNDCSLPWAASPYHSDDDFKRSDSSYTDEE